MLKHLSQDKTSVLLIGVIFILQCAGLLFSFFHLPVTGDESILMIMAQDIANGVRPLLFYSQPYQFPLESYIFAPFAALLDPSISSARLPGWLLRQLGLLFIILTILRLFLGRIRHALLLLVALPPVYVFILTAFYGIPQYSFMFFGFGFLCWLLSYITADQQVSSNNIKTFFSVLFATFFCGLSLSSYSLSILFVAPFLIVLCFYFLYQRNWYLLLISPLALIIGLIPMILARLHFSDPALDSLTATISFAQALDKLYNLTLPVIIPKLMGAESPTYAIWTHEHISYTPAVAYICVVFFLLLALCLLIRVLRSLWKREINADSMFSAFVIGSIILGIIAFSFTARAKEFTPRYLIVAVWLLPFLVGYALAKLKHGDRIVSITVAALVLFNLTNIVRAIDKWRAPDFLTRVADTPPLHNEIDQLVNLGITHCFASYLYAHRLTYLSNRQIHCIQPYNERFPGWPLPYRKEFIKNPEVAYLMSQTHGTLYNDYGFALHLDKNQMGYETRRIGVFKQFYNFHYKGEQPIHADAPIVFLKKDLNKIQLPNHVNYIRVVATSNHNRPKALSMICDNRSLEIPTHFKNFYYDESKPLMFVDNLLIDASKCQHVTLSKK